MRSRSLFSYAPAILLWSCHGLYVLSLFLSPSRSEGSIGFYYAVFGWMGIGTSCWANWTWLANPALWLAWLFTHMGVRPLGIAGSALAAVVASSYLLCDNIVDNEGMVVVPIQGIGVGYWTWLASMLLSVLAAWVFKTRPKQPQKASPESIDPPG